MAQKPNQLIIIGGGFSIKEGIRKGLWNRLKGKFVIGCNYSFLYYKASCQCFVDDVFYKKQKEKIQYLQLVVGKEVTDTQKTTNTIYLPCSIKYNRNLKGGVYKASLVGIFALSLGIFLLDEGEIFLLGYDYGGKTEKDNKNRPITHFYQGDIEHRGIGKTNYYDMEGRSDKDFSVYKNENKVKIYNVSLNSKINVFPKISYNKFFNELDNKTYCQQCLKYWIIKKLEEVKK